MVSEAQRHVWDRRRGVKINEPAEESETHRLLRSVPLWNVSLDATRQPPLPRPAELLLKVCVTIQLSSSNRA